MTTSFPRCDPARPGRTARRPFALAALLATLTVAGGAFSQDKGVSRVPGESGSAVRGMVEPGAAAPGFTVKDIGGESFTFEVENSKSPFLVVFFSIFSDPCRRELAIAQRLHDKHLGAGWRVVAVSLDGEPMRHAVAGFVKQEGYAFRVLVDEPDERGMFKAADPFGVTGLPSTFVVEKGGRIAFGGRGLVKEEVLEKSMQSVPKP